MGRLARIGCSVTVAIAAPPPRSAAPLGKPYRISSDDAWPLRRVTPAPGTIVQHPDGWRVVQQDGTLAPYART